MNRLRAQICSLFPGVLVLALILYMALPQIAMGAASPDRAVYLLNQPIAFDPECEEIPVACVVVDFSGNGKVPTVNGARVRVGDSEAAAKGSWKGIDGSKVASREAFDKSWALLQRPGLKKGAEGESARNLQATLSSIADRSSVIVVNVPKPQGAKLGDSYEVSVEAILDSGETLVVVGTAMTQALTAPSGWVAGDAHMHTDVGSDGWGMSYTVPEAKSLGHKFMYLTDHVDKLKTGIGWNTYSSVAQNWSDSVIAVFPGLEVALVNDIGHCLGYRLPAVDDTSNPILDTIVNQQDTGQTVISNLENKYGAVACVAHPDGPGTNWPHSQMGTGYDGVQVVDGPGESFWRTSMSTYTYNCKPAAIGGSDFHSPLLNSMGAVTWAKTSLSGTWSNQKSSVDTAIRNGATCASSEGSFAMFSLGNPGQYGPGADVGVPLGTPLSVNLTLGAANMASYPNVTVNWSLYQGSTPIRSGGCSLPDPVTGYLKTINGVSSVTISSTAKTSYSIVAYFQYSDASGSMIYDTAYCGPVYVSGQ